MWKQDMLDRAQHIVALKNTVTIDAFNMDAWGFAAVTHAENELEEYIVGKLSVRQCLDLLDWLFDMPYTQATGVLMSLIPAEYSDYHAE